MKWENTTCGSVPVKSWCDDVDPNAMEQAVNLSNHPAVFHHVALMPDCHVGYGMPIGGVIACPGAIIPNAVGVDIGCGMCAVQTSFPAEEISKGNIERLFDVLKARIPLGEGHSHHNAQKWGHFAELPGWLPARTKELALLNLGSLGGGNHFLEVQEGDDGYVWLMLHSGSRNLGYRVADHHHRIAQDICSRQGVKLPSADLAYLNTESEEGQAYIREMQFALDYAKENRARMMENFKAAAKQYLPGVEFVEEINIHHNYAAEEEHFGETVWVHRKGATAANEGQLGIIPGSMGTPSYIVSGKGNADSYCSCSHGAGRVLGRMQASRQLSKEECDKAMEGIVFNGWNRWHGRGGRKMKGLLDLSEAPQAYKNIESVIEAQLDLIEPLVKLYPLGVLKG